MPSKNSRKKKGRGGRKGKGRGGGGSGSGGTKGRESATDQNDDPQPHFLTSPTDQDNAADAEVAVAVAENWQPGGREMSRRIETDKQIYESALTRLIPNMGCQSQLPRYPRQEDFVDLANRAKLAIYSPDGSAVSLDEMISNPVHLKVMLSAIVLANETYVNAVQVYRELLQGSRGGASIESEALRRIERGRALFAGLSTKAKLLSAEYSRANASFVPVLLHFHVLGVLGILEQDYSLLDHHNEIIDCSTENMVSSLPFYGSYSKTFLGICCCSLRCRASALLSLGRYDEAARDFRGACAACRLYGEPKSDKVICDLGRYTNFHLVSSVIEKMKDNGDLRRPLFSDRERKNIEKEVGLGMYSKARYICRGCSAEPSDSVQLRRCGRCKSAWFCSKACLKKSWHFDDGGHKSDCRAECEEEIFSKELQLSTDVDIEHGYGVGIVANYGPIVIIHDEEKDEYFSGLTDHAISLVE